MSGSKQMGIWGQQMKAIGTSIRYAFAGAIVYGVATAITSLGEFEAKMGEIDSLAAKFTAGGNLESMGKGLEDLGDHALSLSNKWGIAVSGIQDQMRAFYSSGFTNSGAGQAKKWTDVLAQIQLITEGADPASMAVGVAGLTQATGGAGNPALSAARIRDIIAVTLKQSTAFRGEDIARDIGRLSGAGTALRMTPEQIFAVYGTAGMVGGSGAVIGRGVTQLLTASLANPKTKAEKQAFASLGLPTNPDALRQMGGYQVLLKLLQGIGPISGPARSALGNAGLSDEEALGMPGLPTGKISVLYKALGRMESVRQVLSIASVGGADKLQGFLDMIENGEKQGQGLQQANIVNQHRWFQQMNEAQKNARMQVARGFEPIMKEFSKGVVWFSGQTIRHPHVTTAVVGAAAGIGLMMKILAGTSIAGLAGRLPILRRFPGLSRTVGRAPELGTAMLVGAGTAAFTSQGTGTRSNPIWVIIDPLSWFFPGAPSGMAPTGPVPPGGGVPGIFKKGSRRFPRIPGGIGPGVVGTAAVAEAAFLLFGGAGGDDESISNRNRNLSKAYTAHPALRNAIRAYGEWMQGKRKIEKGDNPPWLRAITGGLNQWGQFDPKKSFDILQSNERANRAVRHGGAGIGAGLQGEANVQITLQPADELKKTLKGQKLGVKVPLGTGTIPQHRGKKETHPGAVTR
jgi:hypothetical protein